MVDTAVISKNGLCKRHRARTRAPMPVLASESSNFGTMNGPPSRIGTAANKSHSPRKASPFAAPPGLLYDTGYNNSNLDALF